MRVALVLVVAVGMFAGCTAENAPTPRPPPEPPTQEAVEPDPPTVLLVLRNRADNPPANITLRLVAVDQAAPETERFWNATAGPGLERQELWHLNGTQLWWYAYYSGGFEGRSESCVTVFPFQERDPKVVFDFSSTGDMRANVVAEQTVAAHVRPTSECPSWKYRPNDYS